MSKSALTVTPEDVKWVYKYSKTLLWDVLWEHVGAPDSIHTITMLQFR